MIAFKRGKSRRVLILHWVVLKFPRSKWGARCNLEEAKIYKTETAYRRSLLAPVIWCSAKGGLQVMRAVTPMTEEEFDRLYESNGLPDWQRVPYSDEVVPFEQNKAADWGWLDGRPVALDYAADPKLLDDE